MTAIAEKTLYCLEITANYQDVDLLTGLLTINFPYGWEEKSLADGRVNFKLHSLLPEIFENLTAQLKPLLPTANFNYSEGQAEDWTMAWRQFFTPIACGNRFMILPPWLQGQVDLEGRQAIIIEPASAFGTGHHASTELCLGIISNLLDKNQINSKMKILDLGTGTGILAISLALNGFSGSAIDIDAVAIDNAKENVELNKVCGINLMQGEISLAKGQKFDFIVANILADVLKLLAGDICELLNPGGILILSGILGIQADAVEKEYKKCGLPAAEKVNKEDWTALLFKKPA